MKPPKPLLDTVFDQQSQADGHRFLRLIEELKVKVAADGVSHGILLHKWVDATHIRVVVFEGTPAGKEAAEAMLSQGFDEGPFFGPATEPELSDVVAKVRGATARLQMPEGQALPGEEPHFPQQVSRGPTAPLPGKAPPSHGPSAAGPGRTAPLPPRPVPGSAPLPPRGQVPSRGPQPRTGPLPPTGPQPRTGPLPGPAKPKNPQGK